MDSPIQQMAQEQIPQQEMMQQQLLQQLRDIHDPSAISWWPLAPGWWVLAAVVLGVILWAGLVLYSKYKRNAYRREALLLCEQSFARFKTEQNIATYLHEANELLRRITRQSDQAAASLSGSKWIDYLNQKSVTPFSEDAAKALSELLYHPNPDANVAEIHTEIRRWIENHRKSGAAQHA